MYGFVHKLIVSYSPPQARKKLGVITSLPSKTLLFYRFPSVMYQNLRRLMYEKKCWKIAYVRISRKRGGGGVGGGSRSLHGPKVSTYFKYISPMRHARFTFRSRFWLFSFVLKLTLHCDIYSVLFMNHPSPYKNRVKVKWQKVRTKENKK